LEDAAREADLIAVLATDFAGEPLTVGGSRGQVVVHPLIPELRQHRTTLAGLLRALKLPDEDAHAGERRAQMRTVANARWSRRGSAS
jgi:hypothetical protein